VVLTAQGRAEADSIAQLRAFLTHTPTARGEFTQLVAPTQDSAKGRTGKTARESGGTFAFQRPGRFRWVYAWPYEQIIVADGATLTLFDKDLNQVTIKKVASALPASPAAILFGSNEFERDFAVSDDGMHDGLAWIVARPRSQDTTFDRIEIGLKDNLPGAMVLRDNFGQTTRLKFNKVESGALLPAETFRFVPPKGADVLRDDQ
jgi:outer membrane lipoprotein carrier protein